MKRTRLIPGRARRGVAVAGIAALAVSVYAATPTAAAPLSKTISAGAATERLLSPVSPTGPSTTSADRVLARVAHGGHELTFVEHTAIGTVGVYETSPLGVTPYLASLRSDGPQQEGPTALELYLAVSPDAAPAGLVADHARHRTSPAESIVLPPSNGDDPSNGSCTYNTAFAYDSEWAANWHTGIGPQHDLHAQLSFHDDINGNIGKLYDANRSSARWLAACNFDFHYHGFPDIYLIPVSLVNGVPTQHQPMHVEPGTQAVYWSAGGPEHWQLLMKESLDYNVQKLRDWAIGGAIDQPYGLVGNGG